MKSFACACCRRRFCLLLPESSQAAAVVDKAGKPLKFGHHLPLFSVRFVSFALTNLNNTQISSEMTIDLKFMILCAVYLDDSKSSTSAVFLEFH